MYVHQTKTVNLSLSIYIYIYIYEKFTVKMVLPEVGDNEGQNMSE